MKHNNHAFTLVELLVVIAIIGILATIIMVSYSGVQARSRDSKRKADLQSIASGVQMFYADNKVYPGGKINVAYSVGNIDVSSVCSPASTDGNATTRAQQQWKCLTKKGYLNQWPTDPTSGNSYFVMGDDSQSLGSNKVGYKIISDPIKGIDSFETSGTVPSDCSKNAGDFADPSTTDDSTIVTTPVSCSRFQVSNSSITAAWGITKTQ